MTANYCYPNTVLQIFCKAPVAGTVKTRLTPHLSPEQAAQVHQHLSERTIKLLAESKLCHLQLWCSPDVNHAFFQQMQSSFPLSLHPQSTGNLGQRMFKAIENGLTQYQQVLLIGCDCPSLTKADFIEAIEALIQGHDVVFAPTEDGGYCLVGMNKAHLGLFKSMTWGNAEVFAATLARIENLKLDCYQLKQHWDIDFPEDWARYCAEYECDLITGVQ